MTSLGSVTCWSLLARWSKLKALLTEWRRRISFGCEVGRLGERDLADMRLTSLDAFIEAQNPSGKPSVDSHLDRRRSRSCAVRNCGCC
jgi:hypothetical protein